MISISFFLKLIGIPLKSDFLKCRNRFSNRFLILVTTRIKFSKLEFSNTYQYYQKYYQKEYPITGREMIAIELRRTFDNCYQQQKNAICKLFASLMSFLLKRSFFPFPPPLFFLLFYYFECYQLLVVAPYSLY